jgi:hypothetical protein
MVPAAVASLAAEGELDGAVELVQGFGPLDGFGGVEFFGCLLDLPAAPDFVAEAPVLDLWKIR